MNPPSKPAPEIASVAKIKELEKSLAQPGPQHNHPRPDGKMRAAALEVDRQVAAEKQAKTQARIADMRARLQANKDKARDAFNRSR